MSLFSGLSFFFLAGPQVQGSRWSDPHCLTPDFLWLGKPFFSSIGSLISHFHSFCVYMCACVHVLFGCFYICVVICDGYNDNFLVTCIGS